MYMEKFLVIYLAPIAGLEEWLKIDPSVRKTEEDKMKAAWDVWMEKNGAALIETAGAGKTKLVTPEGITDTKNNIMLYSMVEAASHDEAAALFVDHPHFQIPGGSIEVMKVNVLPGMG